MKTHSTVLLISLPARAVLYAICCALALAALSGCGTKGDLQRPAAEAAEIPAPATSAPPAGDQPRP